MWFSDHISTSSTGELTLAGIPASELAKRFGTPVVVLLEDQIRESCRAYTQRHEYYPRFSACYAGKALLTTGICRLMEQEGFGLDVVSAGELHTAIAAGFPAERINMHGNAKSLAELSLALDYGVGRIVVDNLEEIERLGQLATDTGRTPAVLLRVTPGVRPDTHEYVQTGQVDSKFGFNLEGGLAEDAVRRIIEAGKLNLVGLHFHIGSQIMDFAPFEQAVRATLKFYADVQRKYGAHLDELNVGGGLGISYQPGSDHASIEHHSRQLAEVVSTECAQLGLALPKIIDEPGRSVIARAGVTLYTVESVKQIPGVRNYVAVNGGMTDNPRHALYGSYHHVALAARPLENPAGEWSVSGKCCETGDMLAHGIPLPEPKPGELLALFCTGAYTYSMAGNYNRVPRPSVVLAGSNGVAELVRRETVEDIIRMDEMPPWLER